MSNEFSFAQSVALTLSDQEAEKRQRESGLPTKRCERRACVAPSYMGAAYCLPHLRAWMQRTIARRVRDGRMR